MFCYWIFRHTFSFCESQRNFKILFLNRFSTFAFRHSIKIFCYLKKVFEVFHWIFSRIRSFIIFAIHSTKFYFTQWFFRRNNYETTRINNFSSNRKTYTLLITITKKTKKINSLLKSSILLSNNNWFKILIKRN